MRTRIGWSRLGESPTAFGATVSALAFLLLSGCAHSPTVEYASDSLYLGNPIKRIAVFGSANVFWPRTRGKQAVIDIAESRQCQEQLLGLVQIELKQKGYAVSALAPVGVAFVDPAIDYADFQYVGPDGSDLPWRAMAPVFEYPLLASNPNVERAVRDIIEPMNFARKQGQLSSFQPNPGAVKFIGQTLDPSADTLCYLRAVGNKFSAGRKFGAMMFSRGHVLHDNLLTSLMCVEVETGTVLWRHSAIDGNADPVTPPQTLVARMLQYLPPRGVSISREIARGHGGPVPNMAPSPAAGQPEAPASMPASPSNPTQTPVPSP